MRNRRLNVIVTYIDGEGKSGQEYASKYVDENGISNSLILPPTRFSENLQKYV